MCKFSYRDALNSVALVLALSAPLYATADLPAPHSATGATSATFRTGASIRSTCQTSSTLFLDVDADGDADIVKSPGCGVTLHLNNGNGVFDEGRRIGSPVDQVSSIAMGDIDADGDPDLVVGGLGRTLLVYKNDGKGGFADRGQEFSAESIYARSMALADIDIDGDLDLVVGALNQAPRLYLNDGLGNFSPVSLAIGMTTQDPQSLALGDVDNDGDLDLITGGAGEPYPRPDSRVPLYLYRNSDGTGFKTDAIKIKKEGYVSRVALVDIDGDGDLDLYAGGHGERSFLLNNGKGAFTETMIGLESQQDSYGDAAFGDVDGDGDLDAIVANENSLNRLYLNNGKGSFSELASIPFGTPRSFTCCLALLDINGDRALDIVSIRGTPVDGDTFINLSRRPPAVAMPNLLAVSVRARKTTSSSAAPATIFKPMQQLLIKQRADNMAWRDFDNDGDPDVVLSSTTDGVPLLTFYRNDGGFTFTQFATIQFTKGEELRGISFADVDRDKDVDLLLAHYRHASTVHLNDGTGRFANEGIKVGVPSDRTTHLIGRDVDHDGDIDLIASNHNSSMLYLNDGTGHFGTGMTINPDRGNSNAVVAEDIDNDQDVDVLLGNEANNGSIYLHMNTGDGTLQQGGVRIKDTSSTVWMMLAGDVDGNSTLDLIVSGDALIVYRNQGQGKFDKGVTLDGGRHIALGDVDLDGDLDIVNGDYSDPVRMLRNVGNGGWVPATDVIDKSPAQTLALLDLDADGDLDLVILSTEKGGVGILANTSRHGAVDLYIAKEAQLVTAKAPVREMASSGLSRQSTIRIWGFLDINFLVLIVFGLLVPIALYFLFRRKQ